MIPMPFNGKNCHPPNSQYRPWIRIRSKSMRNTEYVPGQLSQRFVGTTCQSATCLLSVIYGCSPALEGIGCSAKARHCRTSRRVVDPGFWSNRPRENNTAIVDRATPEKNLFARGK